MHAVYSGIDMDRLIGDLVAGTDVWSGPVCVRLIEFGHKPIKRSKSAGHRGFAPSPMGELTALP